MSGPSAPAPGPAPGMNQAMAALWQRHKPANLERIILLESVVAAALRGTLGGEWRRAGEAAAHKLAGGLGTFGLAEGSTLAFRIEALLREVNPDVAALAGAVTDLRAAVEAFETTPGQDPTSGPASGPAVGSRGGQGQAAGTPSATPPAQQTPPARPVPRQPEILVVSADHGLRGRLARGAGQRGWGVKALAAAGPALEYLEANAVDLVIADRLPSEALAPLAARVTTLVLEECGGEEFDGHLAAVTAGAAGYQDRDNPDQILSFADLLLAECPPRPARILLMHHSPSVFDLVRLALPEDDFHLIPVTDPRLCLPTLHREHPDAAVVCLAHPDVDGVTLCRLIRTHPDTRRTPVLALAPSDDSATVEAAFGAGVDDLVIRPFNRAELRLRLLARITRSRVLEGHLPDATPGQVEAEPSGEEAPDAHPNAPERAGVDVALVDDDDSVADVVTYALHLRGLRVQRFDNGLEAARRLTDGTLRVNLILLDVGLPGLDGFGVLSRLRDAQVLGTTPVIMLTARSSEAETLTALGLGAAEHMSKPFSVPILLKRVENALAQGPRP